MKLLSYTFYGRNVICVIVPFFFTAAHFHLALVAASISHFLTTAKKFFIMFSQLKNVSLVFYLLSTLGLCCPFSR